MVTKEFARQQAISFISDLKISGFNPSQAFLFGSVINGSNNKYSDIDLAVWDKDFTGILPLDIEKVAAILVKHHPLELHTFPDDYTAADDPFIEVIYRTGEKIYSNKD